MGPKRPEIRRMDSAQKRGFALYTRKEQKGQSVYQRQLTNIAQGMVRWCRTYTDLEHQRHIDDEFTKGMPDEWDPEQRDIKIVCISDTHTLKPSLPRGDILIHSGDLTNWGSFDELQNQLDWLNEQPHNYKIVIAGNHDLLLDKNVHDHSRLKIEPKKGLEDLRWGSIIYLNDETVNLEVGNRNLKILGSPWTMQSGGKWAFQHPQDQDVWKDKIPNDTDIVVCHSPPFSHLDAERGDKFLNKELARVQPRLVIFGHIHEGYGEELIIFDDMQKQFDSIKSGNRGFLGVAKLFATAVIDRVGADVHHRVTRLINAALIGDFPETEQMREPHVVTL